MATPRLGLIVEDKPTELSYIVSAKYYVTLKEMVEPA